MITNKKADFSTNREKLNTNKVNWEKFKRDLEEKTYDTDFSSLNPIEAYDKINSLIIDTIMEAGAKISKGDRVINPKPSWWTLELDRAVENSKTNLGAYRNNKNSENYSKYMESVNSLKSLTKTAKSKYTQNFVQSLGVNTPTNSIWQVIGGLKGFLTTNQNGTNFDYEDPKIKATIEKLCTNTNAETIDILYTTSNHHLDSKITTYELQYAISNHKIKSSPGKDLISTEIISNLPPNLLDQLKDTYNIYWNKEQHYLVSNQVKFLGVIFDSKLLAETHLKKLKPTHHTGLKICLGLPKFSSNDPTLNLSHQTTFSHRRLTLIDKYLLKCGSLRKHSLIPKLQLLAGNIKNNKKSKSKFILKTIIDRYNLSKDKLQNIFQTDLPLTYEFPLQCHLKEANMAT
ncbi:hypothetical protein TSAR_012707 [Trichomalopsis sarcophagae]|uniref:Uncharacterized protein n=1 Tax=Trichomalopsis sarcophagae TaxID=543379 RepID=A0A232EEZ1_9HYME|nr:hypothetical protein TSAR_012707 [Trichomalopsis sarcophagae]